VVDPADYAPLLEELATGEGLGFETRQRLAAKAFAHTAGYDTRVAGYVAAQCSPGPGGPAEKGLPGEDSYPDTLLLRFRKKLALRYGENPHQTAAFYVDPEAGGASIASAAQLQGKELSYNNIADADTALACVRQFEQPACVIVKHANPCGVAIGGDPLEAYERAFRTDPTSAFGGIIAFNRPLDGPTAAAIVDRQFVEVIVAPAVEPAARDALEAKRNVRVLETGDLVAPTSGRREVRSVAGGLLVQSRDDGVVAPAALEVVTRRTATASELRDLMFAWRVCKYVKSNAIVYARDGMTLGIGAGQMSRVVSSRIAAMKANSGPACSQATSPKPCASSSASASPRSVPRPCWTAASASFSSSRLELLPAPANKYPACRRGKFPLGSSSGQWSGRCCCGLLL
jgi:phosphoribosylaminoimidazolecarboxamide formyltransferase/IMP cyclohydrolase